MIIFDASALVDMARETDKGQVLKQLATTDEKAISCTLAGAEVGSAFRKFVRTDGISADQAQRGMNEALALVDEFYPLEDLQDEALRESIRLDHSIYDMFYFVLARRTGGTLFTLDNRLLHHCQEQGVSCIAEVKI